MIAATALFMVGAAYSQSETKAPTEEATIAVAQEEIAATVVEKKCDKKEGKKACCKDKKHASASGDKKSCDKKAKKACCKDKKNTAEAGKKECSKEGKKDCCKKKTASVEEKKCDGKKKDCCKKKAEVKS